MDIVKTRKSSAVARPTFPNVLQNFYVSNDVSMTMIVTRVTTVHTVSLFVNAVTTFKFNYLIGSLLRDKNFIMRMMYCDALY